MSETTTGAVIDREGGKAKGLTILQDMGYTVPEFMVVPFDADIQDLEVRARIERFARPFGRVAVRSSANIEDGERSSFAGQFDSHLDVPESEVIKRIEDVRGSITTEHVRSYCEAMGLSFNDIQMNVIIQKFSEPRAGGVWMGNGGAAGQLEWVDGRGDAVVNGTVEPHVEIYANDGTVSVANSEALLADDAGQEVAKICQEIQEKLGYDADLEFCITNEGIQWLQLRRVTRAIGQKDLGEVTEQDATETTLIHGEAASPYAASGAAYRLDQKQGADWAEGKILVARATSPADMLWIMTAEGVVTRMGGMLSHSAVVCRELGKACVVGVDIDKIPHNTPTTIDGKAGTVSLG